MTSYLKKNAILIGDAAGIEPATGGGIHLALSYGELAASNIIDSFNSNNFSFTNYKDEFNKSLTGKYINKLSCLANEMYNQKINPLDGVKQIFIKTKN